MRVRLVHLWWLLVPLAVFIKVGDVSIAPNDFWWHLRAGQVIWEARRVPAVDLFSFTRAGAPWMYQARLGELAWHGVYTMGGAPLSVLVHALLVTLSYTVVAWWCGRRHGVRAAALGVLAAAAVGAAHWMVRPQTFSFPLFAFTLVLLERARERREPPWLVVPLLALWANVHSAVLFGLVLALVYTLPRLREGGAWRWGLFALAAPAAMGVTPYGPAGMVAYYLGFLRHPVTMDLNMEFQPLTLQEPDGMLFYGAVLGYILLVMRGDRRPAPEHAPGLLVFGLGTLWSRRVAPWFGFVVGVALAEQLAALPLLRRPLPPGRPLLNAVVLGGLLLVAGARLPWLHGVWPPLTPAHLLTPDTPVEAVAYLCRAAGEGARVYQDMAFASYQIWACPRLRVFADTRIELYPPAQWEDYLAIVEGRFDLEEVARRYRLTHRLLSRSRQPQAIRAAAASPC